MSRKQLTRTVLDGRKVTMSFPSQESLTGYLCGMDDFHWLLVTPEVKKHLVHKGAPQTVSLHDEPTYEQERQRESLEAVVEPFRTHLTRLQQKQ